MEHLSKRGEKRRYPRVVIDLPIDYRDTNDPELCGGIVVDASRGGCLIESLRDIGLGEKLSISVLFPKGFELANFPVTAEVMRKQPHYKRDWKGDTDWKGYRYGLKFVQILEADRWKLEFLLGERSYAMKPRARNEDT